MRLTMVVFPTPVSPPEQPFLPGGSGNIPQYWSLVVVERDIFKGDAPSTFLRLTASGASESQARYPRARSSGRRG